MEPKTQYWFELAEYDLETAQAVFEKKGSCMSGSCAIKQSGKFSRHIGN
jgi:hypothetical protein